MSEYARMCLNKQDSEYASGPKYAKILNMAQSSEYGRVFNMQVLHSVLNKSEYALQISEYMLGSKYARILNMAGL